jgi:hypothetical protein
MTQTIATVINDKDKERFLADLEHAIRTLETKLGPDAPFVRPFICDGPITECDVFIIGVNPRENMPFRPYWNGRNYAKHEWEKEYLWQRYRRGIIDMAAGREPDALASRTRKKVEVFCQAVAPARVLETNIYSVASENEKELDNQPGKDDTVFSLLLRGLQPRIVIAHGATARNYISRSLGVKVIANGSDPAEFTQARPQDGSRATYLKARRPSRKRIWLRVDGTTRLACSRNDRGTVLTEINPPRILRRLRREAEGLRTGPERTASEERRVNVRRHVSPAEGTLPC